MAGTLIPGSPTAGQTTDLVQFFMFRTAYKLPFKLLGIPIHLDVTFLIVLPLFTWIIGSQIGDYIELLGLDVDPEPLQKGLVPYLLGLAAAIGLFTSVLIHELGHCVVGQRLGMEIRRITLWILGGMAQFEKLPSRPSGEAVMAIAGPITSFLIAGICWAATSVVPSGQGALQFLLTYLALMNVVLAVFNLLPALPLDGGRVLRALLAMQMPRIRATQIAAGVSKFLAVMLGLLGFLGFNVILMLIALFIYMAVSGETQMTVVAGILEGIPVKELMSREVKTVNPGMPVSELVSKMLQERHLGYPVVNDDGKLVGMVSLEHLRSRGGPSGHDLEVADVMSDQVNQIGPEASALEAFQRISRNNFDRLVVVDSAGNTVGIVSKTDLVRVVQVRIVGDSLEAREAMLQS